MRNPLLPPGKSRLTSLLPRLPVVLRNAGMMSFLFSLLATSVRGETSPSAENDALTALRNLKIDSGTIRFLQRDDTPTVTINGHTLENVPPRTILKILLTPARGSHINVEVWLPDPTKWNGRLVGLGNGGAAGSINEEQLLSRLTQGYAAVTTDMGTAPNPGSGIGTPRSGKTSASAPPIS